MKKTKEAKIWENKKRTWNEDLWKRQVYYQNQLMSKPTKKSVLFRIKMERVSVFFLFSFFCLLLPIYSFFFLSFVIFSSAFCYLYIEKISVFLSLSTFQVINTVFLNEMWYKGLIQKILGCGVFFFFLRKLKIWWFDWISCYFSYFALWEIVRNNLFLLNFQLGLK